MKELDLFVVVVVRLLKRIGLRLTRLVSMQRRDRLVLYHYRVMMYMSIVSDNQPAWIEYATNEAKLRAQLGATGSGEFYDSYR